MLHRFAATLAAALLALPLFAAPTHAQQSRFTDAGRFAAAAEALAQRGVTEGCAPDRFCPGQPVTRAQFASFLDRALDLPGADRNAFDDDDNSVHEDAIDAVAAAGITKGCTTEQFCPRAGLTRGEVATFLVRAFDVPPTQADLFGDDQAHPHEANLNAVAAAGLTHGCDALKTRICPEHVVARGEMANLLARVMNLVPRTSMDVLMKPGDRGPQVAALQQRLAEMRYWLAAPDGHYGTTTKQAVMAFQKAQGITRDGVFGPGTRQAMAIPQPVGARSGDGLVLEIDKDRQLLVVARDGVVQNVFNTSTASGERYRGDDGDMRTAITPSGHFELFRQIDGWRESYLGRLYRPKYFTRSGIAVHGSTSVPAYPASHGCVRVSMAAADYLWQAIPLGTDVWVY